MSASLWRTALGMGREPSADQVAAITAPPTGRHSVDAGAGTGKTATLALRALYLIESEHVRADQIVVVTFTRKAAAEIGARIGDTIDRAITNGAHFAGDGRGVRCTTIHALAADVLREYAYTFGFVAPPRAITDGEAYAIFHDAFVALLDERLAIDTSAFPIGEMHVDQLERDLGKLALRLKGHGISPDDFEARAIREIGRFATQTWDQLWTLGKSGKPTDRKPDEPTTREQREREASRETSNVAVVAELFREFDRRLLARNAATYGDLIGMTTRLVRAHTGVMQQIRARYRYVLLDESQDTSEQQLALIETLFGKPGDADAAGMMPVGDRRQAIYSFNGADEAVMSRIASAADATHPLFVNRRSPQEIVDAGHEVLRAAGVADATTPRLEASAKSAGWQCVRLQHFADPDGRGVADHVKVEARAIAGEIERLLAEPETHRDDIAILVRKRTHAAAYVRALNERGVTAALDRRSGLFTADEIRDALAWLALVLDLGNQMAAIRILQSPLCGISDASAIALTANTDWLARALRDEALAGINDDTRARLATFRARLVAMLPIASLPLHLAMEQLARHVPIAASYARLGETIGAQAIVNLRGFDVLASEFAGERPGARLRDFVDDIERRILYDDDPQEAELDFDGVRVLTIHQAKGLEWPYVFVACSTAAQYRGGDPSDRVVNYDLRTGNFALKCDIDGIETFRWLCAKDEHDATTGARVLPSTQKQLAAREQARVFYVALTRARKRVYVTAPAAAPGKDEAPYVHYVRDWADSCEPGTDLSFVRDGDGSAHSHGDVSAATPPIPPIPPMPPMQATRIVALGEPAALARLSTYRPRISFSAIAAFETCPRMARYRYRLHVPGLREAAPRFVGLDESPGFATSSARTGSLAHLALEHWGRARIDARPITIAAAFDAALLSFADVTDPAARTARANAERAVEALATYEILDVEQTFATLFGETTIEGAIDLIARDERGRVVVIDYKTGRTAGEHYRLQLALYRYVATLRYASDGVEAAILRLTPQEATFEYAEPLTHDAIGRAVAEAGLLESDEPRVGTWCGSCVYRGAPCYASSTATRPHTTRRPLDDMES